MMRWIVMMMVLLAPMAVARAGEERAGQVLSLLDLAGPELAATREAMEGGRALEAMERLLEHFREREVDYHFDAGSPIRDLPGEDGHLHDPMRVPSVRGMPVGVHDTTSPADALKRQLTFLSDTVEFGEEVDWRHQTSDREWNFMLNRHTYFMTLTEAYRRSGDERYMEELVTRFREWDRQVESRYPRRLEAGIRMRHWTWLFPVAVQSPHFDAEMLTIFLENLHETCEWLNARGAASYGGSNQGAMEAVGVLHAATYFPEFRQARIWAEAAAARMANHIFDSTYEDGVYRGRSPGYHNVTLREMNWYYQLMRRAGQALPEAFEQRLHAMIDHAIAFTKPDLTIPQFGHSDRDFMEDRLTDWGKQAERPDALFLATRGQEGSPSAWTDKIFPDGKFALLRSGWEDGEAARWSMFDFGPRGRGADRCLAVELYAYGQSLIVAPGRYTYSGAEREPFHSTRLQNTVSIDGRNQSGTPASGLERQKLGGNLKLLHGWHDGYSHLAESGDAAGIVHERQVLMVRDRYWIVADLVRVNGSGERTFDQNWRFLPTELRRIEGFDRAVVADYGNAKVAIVPLAGEGEIFEEESWFAPKYGARFPAPRLSFRHRSGNGWFFVTLLAPFEGDEFPLSAIDMRPGENAVEGRVAWNNGYVDAIRLSFGEKPGEGGTRWKGWRNGDEIGEEAAE